MLPSTCSAYSLLLTGLFCMMFASSSLAATFLVTTTEDSGDGSLRSAIDLANMAANEVNGPDRIEFNIPGEGVHSILPTSPLPEITDPVIIDGYTQGQGTVDPSDDAQPNTNPVGQGSNAVPLIELSGVSAGAANGLTISAGSSTVRGLVINRWNDLALLLKTKNGNTIQGNILGLDPTGSTAAGNFRGILTENSSNNLIGGPDPAHRNVVSSHTSSGITLQITSRNVVQGNFIGTDISGSVDLGNSIGISISTNSIENLIGGAEGGTRNVISGNNFAGVTLSAPGSSNRIQGNYIGTDVTGMAAVGNFDGINIDQVGGASLLLIGGTESGEGNLISGNVGSGVVLLRGVTQNTVQGNLIGTDATGMGPLGNQVAGVRIGGLGGEDSLIGGTTPTAGNIIAFNVGPGVFIDFLNIGIQVLGNSIFSNGALGIDLSEGGNQGVTLNDEGDVDDMGGNHLQNFPEITLVERTTNLTLYGTFSGAPDSQYRIELYASPECDPSGYGEGKRFLEPLFIVTDGQGNAEIEAIIGTTVSDEEFITATASLRTGFDDYVETSEFSLCVPVTIPCTPIFPDLAATGRVDGGDIVLLLQEYHNVETTLDLNCEGGLDEQDLFHFATDWYVSE